MRYVAAYLLLKLGGNENPKAADIENVLKSVGIDIEKENITQFLKSVDGKDINELIASGSEKLCSMGGGAAGGAAATPVDAPAAAKEEKKEEKKKEESESEDEDMGFGLFD